MTDKHSLPGHNKKCSKHPKRRVELHCVQCQTPVCSKCVIEKHNGHEFSDLDDFCTTVLDHLKEKVFQIKNELLPKSRSSLYKLQCKEQTIRSHISDLMTTVEEYEVLISERNPSQILEFYKTNKLELSQLRTPQLKEMSESDSEIFSDSTHKEDDFLFHSTQSNFLFQPVEVPFLTSCHHFSFVDQYKVWMSDHAGNLVLLNLKCEKTIQIVTNGGDEGYHAVTTSGDLLYVDKVNKCIKKFTRTNGIQTLATTKEWRPISICCSRYDDSVFVGMVSDNKAIVVKYSKEWKNLLVIRVTEEGTPIFNFPFYLTENSNRDICVSDVNKHNVVVLNENGRIQFSYNGHVKGEKTGFWPHGISVNDLGHIFVCNTYFSNPGIHVIDKNGQFLALHPTGNEGIKKPRGVGVDKNNDLWVGQLNGGIIGVYRQKSCNSDSFGT